MSPIRSIEANTFSIVARCASTGEFGVAVASAVPAVGSICPFLRAGVGAVSTQSWVNPYLAVRILDAMQAGSDAHVVVGGEILAVLQNTDAGDVGNIDLVARNSATGAGSGSVADGPIGSVPGAVTGGTIGSDGPVTVG